MTSGWLGRGSSSPAPFPLSTFLLVSVATLIGVLLGLFSDSLLLGSSNDVTVQLHSAAPTPVSRSEVRTARQFASLPFPSSLPPRTARPSPVSDLRGYVAVQYSGTARSFSIAFISHLLHIVCSSPFTVHLFFTVMVHDNSSEHLSVSSTLARYAECQNPDGDWLSISAAVKGWRLQRQTDVEYEEVMAEFVAMYRAAGVGWQENALKLYWAQHSVDLLRRAYEEREGVVYSWVSRQRLDVVLATDLWQSLFSVTPLWDYLFPDGTQPGQGSAQDVYGKLTRLELRPQRLPDRQEALARVGDDEGNIRSYLVGDLVFTPREQSHSVHLPGCSGYGGTNDQFAIGDSAVMRAYFQRGFPPYLNVTRGLVSRVAGLSWYQTETFLSFSLRAHEIEVQYMPDLCFQLLYTHHAEETAAQQNGHTRPTTECSIAPHGRDCCAQSCSAVNERRERAYQSISRLSSAAPDSIATHGAALHGLALRLAELSPSASSEAWKATLSVMEAASSSVQLTAASLLSNSSTSADHYSLSHSPSSIDHTPPATHAYLQSVERGDEVEGSAPAGQHFALYSRWVSLARRLALQVSLDGNASAVGEVESRAEASGDLGRFTWWTLGTEVGRSSGFCNAAADWNVRMFPYTYAERRMDILRLAPEQEKRSRFKQHEACTHQWSIRYTV